MRKWIKIAIAVAAAILASPLCTYPALAVLYDTATPIYIVQNSSLEPKFGKGDLLFVNHRDHFDMLVVGDFILFKHPHYPDKVSLGFVIEKLSDKDSTPIMRVKTTLANPASIPEDTRIYEDNYIGRIVGMIPLGATS